MSSTDENGQYVYVFYNYTPSLPAAIVFAVLFFGTTCLHFVYLFRKKALYFIPFVIGGLCEIVGYCGRAASHSDREAMIPYIIQSLLLLIAPVFMAATIYMILGRFVRALEADKFSIIRPKWLTKLFVTGDIICFFIQGGGAGIQAKSDGDPDKAKMGENIILGGLALQVIIFCIFLVVASIFHRRLAALPTRIANIPGVNWQRGMISLYIASSFILIRNIVRLVEYGQGKQGFIQNHEFMIYIFDGVLIFIAMASLIVFHPGSVVLAIRQLTANDGPGFENVGSVSQTEESDFVMQPQKPYAHVPQDSGLPGAHGRG